jgi:hypothetical protein
MTKLRKEGNNFFITNKKTFNGTLINESYVKKTLDFSIEMSFGKGYHRNYRSGGSIKRNEVEIFSNTFQGKLSEFSLIQYLKSEKITINSEPDLEVYGKGIWDTYDLIINSKKINIKSCAHIANLVLLEKKDWNKHSQYIPNMETRNSEYDYFILIRIKEDIKKLTKKYLSRKYESNIVDSLRKEILSNNFYFEITGFFTSKTLKYIIENNYVLPKNSFLNGKVKVDADNYYLQSGNLKNISEIINELQTN